MGQMKQTVTFTVFTFPTNNTVWLRVKGAVQTKS